MDRALRKLVEEAGLPDRFEPLLLSFCEKLHTLTLGEQQLLVLGDDEGTKLCLRSDGCVLSVDPEGELPTRFVNASPGKLARCIGLYQSFVALEDDAPRVEGKTLREALAAIDPLALEDEESWWSLILEEFELE